MFRPSPCGATELGARGRVMDCIDTDDDSSEVDGGSRPVSATGDTYEDEFERGLEAELSCSFEDDRVEDLVDDRAGHSYGLIGDEDGGDSWNNGHDDGGQYVLDHSSYGDCDEDLETELTLGLGRRASGGSGLGGRFFRFERDHGGSTGNVGTAANPARSFLNLFKRQARIASEPSLSTVKDSYYDAPDEVGYDSTPDSGVHESLQNLDPEQRAKQEEEWKNELLMIEEEIQTLKSVLSAKMNRSQVLKRKLGISVWREFREDMEQGIKNVKETDAYKSMNDKLSEFHQAVSSAPLYVKTETVIKSASEKTTTVLGSIGASVTRKLGEVKNSPTYKSFEEKVGSAYTNVKTKVSSRSSSMQSFDEEFIGDGRVSTGATPATTPLIPEEKPIS